MDRSNPVYLLLDRMRESQLQQNTMLEEIIGLLKANSATQAKSGGDLPSRIARWMPLLKPIGAAMAQYGVSLLLMAYIVKGGDLMTVISVLLKLL